MHASAPIQPKPDNLFGVCAALGEDFGFNPLYLRIALGAGILWNAGVVAAVYVALGVVVLATRLLFPNAKAAPAAEQPAPRAAIEAANADEPALPLAA
jgi:phage shock protein PspC (stress-responsive transcriptional regulator)